MNVVLRASAVAFGVAGSALLIYSVIQFAVDWVEGDQHGFPRWLLALCLALGVVLAAAGRYFKDPSQETYGYLAEGDSEISVEDGVVSGKSIGARAMDKSKIVLRQHRIE